MVIFPAGERRSTCFLLIFAAAETAMADDELGVEVGVVERLKVRKLEYSV